jgi:uncharacterized spore protein YtfJ
MSLLHMTTEDILKEAASELKELINGKNVLGAPVDLGDRVLITVSRFGLGFGAGSGKGKDGDGSGAGGGGGIEPVALLVIHKGVSGAEGISIFSLRGENAIAQVVRSLGETIVPTLRDILKKDSVKEDTGESSGSTGV